jgi:hypothetical protein
MVEPTQEDMELPTGESECDKPSEQPEGLGTVDEQSELTTISSQGLDLQLESGVLPAEPVEASNKNRKETSSQDTNDLRQMLA